MLNSPKFVHMQMPWMEIDVHKEFIQEYAKDMQRSLEF